MDVFNIFNLVNFADPSGGVANGATPNTLSLRPFSAEAFQPWAINWAACLVLAVRARYSFRHGSISKRAATNEQREGLSRTLRERGMNRANNFTLVIIAMGLLFSLSVFGQSRLPASAIKTIYVVPSSHYDFGFVEPPDAIRERAARHIDEVIRVAEENPDFRWTIESVWQVNEWLKRQKKPSSVLPPDKEKIARLMNLIKSGRIVLSTAWGSMHTDFMGTEELNRINYDYVKLDDTYGISSEVAYMNDVPGHPMSVASVLADSGTKYMVTGANTFIGTATTLAPGKVPFYWEAPDGNKVLLWVSQGNRGAYVEAFTQYYLDPYSVDPYTDRKPFDMFNPELAGKKTDIEMMEIGVTGLLNDYNKAGYKYDAVMAMYAHDFFEPSNVLNLLRAAKMWNAKHDEVKIKVATSPEFFKYIESKYGSEIPTYRGEWSGLWSEAKTASPRISEPHATRTITHRRLRPSGARSQ